MSRLPFALRTLRDAVDDWRAEWRDRPNRTGRAYAVTLLTPVLQERCCGLTRVLEGLGRDGHSPLAKLPSVHFGRWVVIDQLKAGWPGAPTPFPRLESPYLLFTADVTSAPEDAADMPRSFFEDLRVRIPREADAIWGHCRGYPGAAKREPFLRYMTKSQVGTSLYYGGYPDYTVQEVQDALDLRRELQALVRRHEHLLGDPVALRDAYLELPS